MSSRLLFPLIFFSIVANAQQPNKKFSYSHGAMFRGDSTRKELSLVFTADEFGEGLPTIIQTLKKENVKAGFFFTGRFYRNDSFKKRIQTLQQERHYLGPHSDQHLLYCDWTKRDSLLVTRDSFQRDIRQNMMEMEKSDLAICSPHYFIPSFEWWNDSIASWSKEMNLCLFNFTPGIRTATDYTWPELPSYKSSEWIMNHVKELMATKPSAFNGAIILIHAGTDPKRNDKFYHHLSELIRYLKQKGYQFKRIDSLLSSQ